MFMYSVVDEGTGLFPIFMDFGKDKEVKVIPCCGVQSVKRHLQFV